ncbi:tRNA 2-thiocytidine(32) synthetase TtcA [bacterium]|nr:tRNA 2-thiocytidine(32) synthetase TtcA [bacterium]
MGNTVKTIQRILGKALRTHKMIQEGDRVLIGVSGGKDSLALLQLMVERQRYVKPHFTLIAGHIDGGFPGSSPQNLRSLRQHFEDLGIESHIIKKNIAEQALDPNATKNPCFICSHHRRHAIYKLAHDTNCTKIAYAHHKDDIIETLLLNIFYGRKIEAMHPVQEVFRGSMHIIRPLAYADESLIRQYARKMMFPIWPKICPADGKTRRERIKKLIRDLQIEEKNANIKENIFKSLQHVHLDPQSLVGGARR